MLIQIGVILILLCCLFYLCACIYFFRFAIVRNNETMEERNEKDRKDAQWCVHQDKITQGIQWILSKNPEIVEIQSEDGLTLCAYYLKQEISKKTMILVHGHRSWGLRDFSCISKFYYELGFNLLIIDQRSHGKSQGRYICFGIKERYDCLKWINYINEREPDISDIFLEGVSMGAATVLMTSGLTLPDNVRGIIADCGFTSPWNIFSHVIKENFHMGDFPVLFSVDKIARKIAKFGFKDTSTFEALKSNTKPILFIHGGSDYFVPTRMSVENFEACTTEKKLVIIEGAGHAQSYLINKEKCEKAICEFLTEFSTQKL